MSQEKMWLEQVNKTINANTINIILDNVFCINKKRKGIMRK